MARPRVYSEPRVPTAVRLPESVHQRLRTAAEERAVSANLLVTRAVEEYLDRLPPLSSLETSEEGSPP
jgi:predicted HicB family RNase H-like nuclease